MCGQYVFLWHLKLLPFDVMFVYCLLIFDLYDWFTQGNHSSYAHISNECLCNFFCLRDQFICHSCQWISYVCCVLNPTIIVSHLYIVIVNIRNSEWWSISKIHPNLTVELVKRLGDDISKEMANWFINYRNITIVLTSTPYQNSIFMVKGIKYIHFIWSF